MLLLVLSLFYLEVHDSLHTVLFQPITQVAQPITHLAQPITRSPNQVAPVRVGRPRCQSLTTFDNLFLMRSFLSKSDGADRTRLQMDEHAPSVAATPSLGLFMIW